MVMRWLGMAMLVLAAACPGRVAWAAVEAHFDPSTVGRDESVRLTIEAEGGGDPDFSALEADFEILGRSQRSNLSVANGRLTRSHTWVLNLMPKRSGTITVAPIKVGREATAALTLEVTDTPPATALADDLVFLEASATPLTPYVQQQVIVTVQLWRRAEIQNTNLSEPRIEGGTGLVRTLGDDRNFQAERGGRRYQVVERRYTVFPQTSGTLTVAPLELTTQVVRGVSSFLDPFAHDVITRRLRTAPITLDVKPVPAGFPGKTWLPARQIQLQEVWSEDGAEIDAAEPLARTVALIADGLTAGQLPELQPASVPDFKTYPEQPQLSDQASSDGVIAVRQEKVAFIPARGETRTLPGIEVPWWNVETDRLEIARLPERRVRVRGLAPAPAPATQAPSAQPPASTAVATTPGAATYWVWVAALAATAWAVTGGAWMWSVRRRRHGDPRGRPADASAVGAWRSLRRAVDTTDPARIRGALLDWGRVQWPQSPPTTLPELARRCTPALAREVLALDAALYAQGSRPWDAAGLRAALEQSPANTTTADPRRPSALQPLHPG